MPFSFNFEEFAVKPVCSVLRQTVSIEFLSLNCKKSCIFKEMAQCIACGCFRIFSFGSFATNLSKQQILKTATSQVVQAPPSSIDPIAFGFELGECPPSNESDPCHQAPHTPCCTAPSRALPLKPFRRCVRTLTFCQFQLIPTIPHSVLLGATRCWSCLLLPPFSRQFTAESTRIHLPIPGHAMGGYGLRGASSCQRSENF